MSPAADRLRELILRELENVPIDRWGYFFPFMLAFWKYIEAEFPGVLGELSAVYATEPELTGEGAEWFCHRLMDNVALLDIIEALSYGILQRLPQHVVERGFLYRREIPPIPEDDFERLAQIIAREVAERDATQDTPAP